MPMSLNKIMLIGNLGADVDYKETDNGLAIAKFSVATNETYKNKDDETVEKTEWHRITAFGRLAEICQEYLKKGDKVFIEGKFQTSKWTDKEGNDVTSRGVVASQMIMLSWRQKSDNDSPDSGSSDNFNPGNDDIPY